MNCPFHGDAHSSFSINPETGLFKCYVSTCKAFDGGNLTQFIAYTYNISTREAYLKILEDNGIKEDNKPLPKELSEESVFQYHTALLDNETAMQVLLKKYLYTLDTITKFRLGWNGERITIPIYDEQGKVINIRKKPLDSGHCIGVEFYNQMRLYPIQNIQYETIYLFEGEKDCILANQLGLNAMTVTSGAGSFNQEWTPLFKDKVVYICYDIDAAGLAGAHRIKEFLLNVTQEIKIVQLPIKEPPNGDFTDYILQGNTIDAFKALIKNTAVEIKLIHQKTRISDHVYNVSLAEAANAEYYFKRVAFNVIVSGKDTQPYLPPKEIDIICPMGQPYCKYCGLAPYGGKYTVKLNHLSQDILQWIDCTEEHHSQLIKRSMEIPLRCKMWKTFVSVAQTMQEITLIPEIEYTAHDTEYVVRSAYVIGKSVKTNHNYRLEAITLPHPLTQYATHLIYSIQENKTAIDEFKMTPEILEDLQIFCVIKEIPQK